MRIRTWTPSERAARRRFAERSRERVAIVQGLAGHAQATDEVERELACTLPPDTPAGAIVALTMSRPCVVNDGVTTELLSWLLSHSLAVDEPPGEALYAEAPQQVFFPWDRIVRRYPSRDELLRQLRLRSPTGPLAKRDAAKLNASRILFAGLSAGRGIADALVGGGLACALTILDDSVVDEHDDTYGATQDVAGMPRSVLLARRLWRVNPYAEIDVIEREVTSDLARAVLSSSPVAIAVDALGDPVERAALRKAMRAGHVALLTIGEEDGHLAIVGERFDKSSEGGKTLDPFRAAIPEPAVHEFVRAFLEMALDRRRGDFRLTFD